MRTITHSDPTFTASTMSDSPASSVAWNLQPIRTEDYPVPAPRPAYSVLSPRAWQEAGLPVMPAWRESLREAFRLYGNAFKP